MSATLQTYAQHRPTGFDCAGAFLDDRQDWLVVPVSRTRDSGSLEESNMATVERELQGLDSETWELHRFGHWACGWYEIILVAPGSTAHAVAQRIADRLEGYPVLDEDDWSRREWESANECWASLPLSERVEMCQEQGLSVFAARHAWIPQGEDGSIVQRLAS